MFKKAVKVALADKVVCDLVAHTIKCNRAGTPDWTAYAALATRFAAIGIQLPAGYETWLRAAVGQKLAI